MVCLEGWFFFPSIQTSVLNPGKMLTICEFIPFQARKVHSDMHYALFEPSSVVHFVKCLSESTTLHRKFTSTKNRRKINDNDQPLCNVRYERFQENSYLPTLNSVVSRISSLTLLVSSVRLLLRILDSNLTSQS